MVLKTISPGCGVQAFLMLFNGYDMNEECVFSSDLWEMLKGQEFKTFFW